MRKRKLWFFVSIAALALLATGSVANAKSDDRDIDGASVGGPGGIPVADPDGRGKAVVVIDVAAGRVCFRTSSCPMSGHPTAATSMPAPRG